MIEHRVVHCQHDGTEMVGRIDLPQGPGPHPAILVFPTARGMMEHVLQVSKELAGQGYVALTVDMHGSGAFFNDSNDPGAATRHLMPLFQTPGALRARVVAWFEQLRAQPDVDSNRIAAIGYCLGGQCVLELARHGADLKLVVSFHGTLGTSDPAQPGAIKATVAVYNGDADPFVSRESVTIFEDEMRSAGARWFLTHFGGVKHCYTDPGSGNMGVDGNAYDEFATFVTWAGTSALLERFLLDKQND